MPLPCIWAGNTRHNKWLDFILVDDYQEMLKGMMFKDASAVWHCTNCEYTSLKTSGIKNHIEAKHIDGLSYSCQYCDSVCRTKNALEQHISRKHKVWINNNFLIDLDLLIKSKIDRRDNVYACTECDYTTPYPDTCRNHVEARHLSTSGYTCQICNKFCSTRNAMKIHYTRYHNKSA